MRNYKSLGGKICIDSVLLNSFFKELFPPSHRVGNIFIEENQKFVTAEYCSKIEDDVGKS